MSPSPLPLAPRPHSEEALSSWVQRVAARYDILGDELIAYLLGRRIPSWGSAEKLDHRADPALEVELATATRVDVASIRALRVVRGDGSTSGWHRLGPAWCSACVSADLAEHGEIYERASWRLGSSVLCRKHDIPLTDVCSCARRARCRLRGDKGRLRLICDACGRLVEGPSIHSIGRIQREVKVLQDDLERALTGSSPGEHWPVRSGEGLLTMVRDLTLAVIVTRRLKFEERLELPEPEPGQTYAPVHTSLTLAALPVGTAFDVLAQIASVLRTLGGAAAPHRREAGFGTNSTDVGAFVAWLSRPARRHLAALAAGWEEPAGSRLRALCSDLAESLPRSRVNFATN